MSRFGVFADKFIRSTLTKTPDFFLDFGSSYTKLMIGGRVVFHQPTCLAWKSASAQVVSIGDEAQSLLGKTTSRVELQYPLCQGVVDDIDFASYFLSSLVKLQAEQSGLRLFSTMPRVTCGVPAELSPVEAQQFAQVFSQAGITNLSFIKKTAAISRLLAAKTGDQPILIIDIGGQSVELGLFAGMDLIAAQTIRQAGGDNLTKHILKIVRGEKQVEIGRQEAEKVKFEATSLSPQKSHQDRKIVIRGKDMMTHVMATITLSSDLFTEVFKQETDKLTAQILHFLSEAPAEMVTKSLERGVFLTGGGSLLDGCGDYLSAALACEVTKSASPFWDTVKGLSR